MDRVGLLTDDKDDTVKRYYFDSACCGLSGPLVERRPCCGKRCYFPPRRSHDAIQLWAHILTPLTAILCAFTIYSGYNLIARELTTKSTYTIAKSIAIFGIISLIFIASFCAAVYCWWRSCACRQAKTSIFSEDEDDYRMSIGGFPLPPSMQGDEYREKQEAYTRKKMFKILRFQSCCCFRED